MRNLGDWRGYRVRVEGTVKKVEDNRLLLVDVKVHLYSNGELREIDHVWCYHPEGEKLTDKPGDEILGLADVIEYERRDRSRDYAFRYVPSVDLESKLEMLHQSPKLAARVEIVQMLLGNLKIRNLLIPPGESSASMKVQLNSMLQNLQTSLRLEEKATANQLRGQLNADPVQFKSAKKSSKGKGFG